jgi:glycosyltransferase involved in cell wall biosynthesis
MRIGMLLDNEFTGDLRVENEVISLVKAGHEVYVFCLNYGDKKDFETYYGAKIFRKRIKKSYINKMRGLTNTFFDFYPYFWTKNVLTLTKRFPIDCIHAHDLHMLPSAFKINKKLKVKVVADLHENYVDALKHYSFVNTFPGNILISIKKWYRKEREWLAKVDSIITVIEEAVQRYIDLGIKQEKIYIVENYLNEATFNAGGIQQNILNQYKSNFTLSYIGGFDGIRGIEYLINAVPYIVKEINNFKLILVGDGENKNDLKQLTENLNISDYVDFIGRVAYSEVPSYIAASDVCSIPHLKNSHTDNTIPHKLFQYMALKKPVLVTNCLPLKRIVESSNSGKAYQFDSSYELSEKIVAMYKNSEELQKMGDNGAKVVNEIYNWRESEKVLVKMYEDLNI